MQVYLLINFYTKVVFYEQHGSCIFLIISIKYPSPNLDDAAVSVWKSWKSNFTGKEKKSSV